MLNFSGYDVSESRRLFNSETQSTSGSGTMQRSAGSYLHGFTDTCYDPSPVNHYCSPSAAYGQSLSAAGYPVSVPTYASYRLPFSVSHVYDEHRKLDRHSKRDLSCTSNISAHGINCLLPSHQLDC